MPRSENIEPAVVQDERFALLHEQLIRSVIGKNIIYSCVDFPFPNFFMYKNVFKHPVSIRLHSRLWRWSATKYFVHEQCRSQVFIKTLGGGPCICWGGAWLCRRLVTACKGNLAIDETSSLLWYKFHILLSIMLMAPNVTTSQTIIEIMHLILLNSFCSNTMQLACESLVVPQLCHPCNIDNPKWAGALLLRSL